ncbi:MAG: hypothetical protein KBG22_04145 [Smithella sp.]|nr:hypothetical protein [Smithella sp.]MDM7987499.1 hypothetical protein [Smithella sp.]HOU52050.1 hypothetical protein [Smithella sp.]HQG66714.1 hypothetical protein [Smithella sp.]HQH17473.1 hypothetical protein [Smithella sp.]
MKKVMLVIFLLILGSGVLYAGGDQNHGTTGTGTTNTGSTSQGAGSQTRAGR